MKTIVNLDNRVPVDFRSPAYEPLFRRLQGNILKGHGRNFTANIFLEFNVTGRDLTDLLRWIAERFVTSAYDQLVQTEIFHSQARLSREAANPGATFGNLFVTRRTYEKLGLGNRLRRWFKDSGDGTQSTPQHANFLTGMFDAADDLGDDLTESTALEDLERAYLHKRIDAMVLLADNSDSRLRQVTTELRAHVASTGVASTLACEWGRVWRNDRDDPVEHFGYADGISQPLFLVTDFPPENGESLARWNPLAPLSRVLLHDPAVDDQYAFGSYYVFRKLEQNVHEFFAAEETLAEALRLDGADRSRAGAMLIGRFRDGTPLALNGTDGIGLANANDFRYDGLLASLQPDAQRKGDRIGLKCPFQAHIRKVNPRQSEEAQSSPPGSIRKREREDRRHAIVRRGITYGVREVPPHEPQRPEDRPTAGVGLLFGCFQRSIINQFAFIQRQWANTTTFKIAGTSEDEETGLDPIIGRRPGEERPIQRWRSEYGGTSTHPEPERLEDLSLSASHTTTFGLGEFVRFRGGEFFFAPSLPFLRGE